MNVLGDTDEGRARPSVWPVYLAAAIPGIYGVGDLGIALLFLAGHITGGPHAWFYLMLIQVARGLLGGLTAVGLLLLRPWGWWCGVVYIAVFVVYVSFKYDYVYKYVSEAFEIMVFWPGLYLRPESLANMGIVALFVWVLTTRRQLFFPPKQEAEE